MVPLEFSPGIVGYLDFQKYNFPQEKTLNTKEQAFGIKEYSAPTVNFSKKQCPLKLQLQ